MNRVLKWATGLIAVAGVGIFAFGPTDAAGAGIMIAVMFLMAFGLLHVKRVF